MKTEKNIFIAFFLNLFFSVFELVGGLFTNSVSILSDAIHDFADAMSIGISFALEKISRKKPDAAYTYGYARYSILGAFITTTVLTVGSILVIISSVNRLFHPEPVNYNGMILFAVIGVVVNFVAAYVTKDGDSVNQKAVNLHMLEDILGWIVVLLGSILMKFTDITVIDSLMSIAVAVYILFNVCKNFKEILDLFLEKTPKGISLDEIKNHLCEIDGVVDVHHIHVWSMDGNAHFATMHVVYQNAEPVQLKAHIRGELAEHGIGHVTIELESINDACEQKDCVVETDTSPHHHHHH